MLVYIDRLSGWLAVHRWHRDQRRYRIRRREFGRFRRTQAVPIRQRTSIQSRSLPTVPSPLGSGAGPIVSTLPLGQRPRRSSRQSNGDFDTQACSNRRIFL